MHSSIFMIYATGLLLKILYTDHAGNHSCLCQSLSKNHYVLWCALGQEIINSMWYNSYYFQLQASLSGLKIINFYICIILCYCHYYCYYNYNYIIIIIIIIIICSSQQNSSESQVTMELEACFFFPGLIYLPHSEIQKEASSVFSEW